MSFPFRGKIYRSYKHPILEYILETRLAQSDELPDEIIFTYEDIRDAMAKLGIQRGKQASLSNFTIDLTRAARSHESRVPDSVWNRGYDLDRASEREARQNVAGRLVRKELKAANAWIVWSDDELTQRFSIPNRVPIEIQPYLGKDEGALLSVMDYCDVLSWVLHQESNTVLRVQHPKKWQPGEVDGLYFSNFGARPTLYPIEAKALSTGDSVNLAQIQAMYKTIRAKIPAVDIVPLAVQMLPLGMYIAIFEVNSSELVISHTLKVELDPPIERWQSSKSKRHIKHT